MTSVQPALAMLALAVALAADLADAATTTIPIEIVDGNNIAIARVGDVPLRLHLDTGGYRSVGLFPAALAKVRVQLTGGTATRTDGSGDDNLPYAVKLAARRARAAASERPARLRVSFLGCLRCEFQFGLESGTRRQPD